MPTPRQTLNPLNQLIILTISLVLASVAMAQDEEIHLSESLDVDTLYQPIASLEVHGETAVSLLEELETKHYRAVEVDDNFSSAIFHLLLLIKSFPKKLFTKFPKKSDLKKVFLFINHGINPITRNTTYIFKVSV